jgi:hypothetical protein
MILGSQFSELHHDICIIQFFIVLYQWFKIPAKTKEYE